ncbi:MAG: hypothetical protein ABS917_05405 [Solibacillus sp.]|uniref:hypothetical protein n=1 Tax=Solibacillus sp. TaxID=1909654 RepID=UPI0033157EBA
MINSITICENITEEFKSVNEKNLFTPKDAQVCALIELGKIKEDTIINIEWTIDDSKQVLIGIYQLPLMGKEDSSRFAVAGLDIQMLLSENIINKTTQIKVTAYLDSNIEYKISSTFILKTFIEYKGNKLKNINLHTSSKEWQI